MSAYTPFAFALSTREYTIALDSAPFGVSQNSQFFRPKVKGRIAFSARLLDNGTIQKLMTQYKKYALLIIDEWLLYPLKETEARELLEIVESRYKQNSTIFCSQYDIPGWPEKLSDPLLSDAI